MLREIIKELQNQGVLHIEYEFQAPPEGKRLYRVELGRYCDDFDQFGSKRFSEMRFHKMKIFD